MVLEREGHTVQLAHELPRFLKGSVQLRGPLEGCGEVDLGQAVGGRLGSLGGPDEGLDYIGRCPLALLDARDDARDITLDDVQLLFRRSGSCRFEGHAIGVRKEKVPVFDMLADQARIGPLEWPHC